MDTELILCVVSVAALAVGGVVGFGVGMASGEAERHDLNETIEQKDMAIQQLNVQLNSAYYAYGASFLEKSLRDQK